MSLSIGIVGLPNVGKSTLFNALTDHSVPAENYPFCTIDPCIGVVPVPDKRVSELSKLSGSLKVIPAVVEFVDIAGLVKGASSGEGLGNKFLASIREVDAIAEVVRVFDDENIIHVHGEVDPVKDISIINFELMMADLETISGRKESLEKERKSGSKKAEEEFKVLLKLEKVLNEGEMISSLELDEREKRTVKNLHLLSAKPFLYVLNKKSEKGNLENLNDARYEKLNDFLEGKPHVVVNALAENEMASLDEEEKNTYRMELLRSGHSEYGGGLGEFVKKSYEMLDLITFFTTGEKETRAWTAKRGSTAPEAGRAVHSDFHDQFIRAEVVKYDKLLEAGSLTKAREKGWVKTEGKDYLVKDGDVIEFKI